MMSPPMGTPGGGAEHLSSDGGELAITLDSRHTWTFHIILLIALVLAPLSLCAALVLRVGPTVIFIAAGWASFLWLSGHFMGDWLPSKVKRRVVISHHLVREQIILWSSDAVQYVLRERRILWDEMIDVCETDERIQFKGPGTTIFLVGAHTQGVDHAHLARYWQARRSVCISDTQGIHALLGSSSNSVVPSPVLRKVDEARR